MWLLMLGGTDIGESVERGHSVCWSCDPTSSTSRAQQRGHISSHSGLLSSHCSNVGLENGMGIGQDDVSVATFYFGAPQSHQSKPHMYKFNWKELTRKTP